jgi:predicted nucleotidyltransferase
MEVQKDFREFVELLNEYKVEFIIVGGFALAFHGVPRFTGDIDVFIKSDQDNAKRVMNTLVAFGFGSLDLSIEDFQTPNNVIQLGLPPVRIDIVTSISGVTWDEAYATKENGLFGDVPVSYIGKKQFIINKRATGRKKDLADLESLGEN